MASQSASVGVDSARLRHKLDEWSDDDDDGRDPAPDIPASAPQASSREPSPFPSIPERKRSIAACLDSDEEDTFPIAKGCRTGDPASPSRAQPHSKAKIPKWQKENGTSPRVHSPSPDTCVLKAGPVTAMQSPIQPGCTQLNSGKRFLAYNMLGSISSSETAGISHVEVDFHDTSRGLRVPAMTDYFGFTMAAMNDKGSVYANPQRGEKNPSTIMYRPFNSWTNNSEWSMRFPVEEEVKAVAIGNGWAAAATGLHFLRVYSEAGLQRFVLSLAGPIVVLAGHEQQLAVVTHASNPLPSGDQVLEFMVLDVREQRRTLAGRLPLSPGATLAWLGFSEMGCLSVYDSLGVLRVYSDEYNGCWIPLFSSAAERKGDNKSFWVVGLNNTQVFCVVCKAPDVEPQVVPKPVLNVFNTAVPVAHSDLGADILENEYLRGTVHLTHMRAKADEAAAAGCEDEEEIVLKMEAELDRCLLRLIAAACKGDKLARALELSTQLSLHKSLEGAIKLVNAMRLPSLAERLNLMLEGRIAQERSETGATLHSGDISAQLASIPTYSNVGVTLAGAPKTPGPLNTRPPSLAEVRTWVPERGAGVPSSLTGTSAESMSKQPGATRPFQPILTKAHKRINLDTVECEQKTLLELGSSSDESHRSPLEKAKLSQGPSTADGRCKPSNPFAKSSPSAIKDRECSDKNVSLLKSLKKMQNGATELDAKRKASAMPIASSTFQRRPLKVGL